MAFLDTLRRPPRRYTLMPFWFLNDDLDDAELVRQIDDFDAHGVYGFIPHARIGLPEDFAFMSERWLRALRVCVEYAAKKDMLVILYDEAMYPSGSCAGRVVAENPRFATRCIVEREPGPLEDDEELIYEVDGKQYVHTRSGGRIRGVHWGTDDGEPGAPPSADILNPDAVATFLRLVHDKHYEALGKFFGSTITGVFTDEPSMLGRGALPGAEAWTWDYEGYLRDTLGEDFRPKLPVLFNEQHPEHVSVRRAWDRVRHCRLREAYYAPYSRWCEDHGIALTGHPEAPDDIGHLRHFQIPGQDVVWRYVEPFKDSALEGSQSTMAKCSASAQRHYGRTRNANEYLGAYGWELTYEEMRWLTNWLLVRGVNLLIPHAFYYSVRGNRRDERPPDVGPNNSWWDNYKDYADYCRRMCWLIAESEQMCSIAILGSPNALPWRTARVLFENQRDFNYLDTATLRDAARIEEGGVYIRGMHYRVVVVDYAQYLTEEAKALLQPLEASGHLVRFEDGRFLPQLDSLVSPVVRTASPTPNLRCQHLRHEGQDIYLFANEGSDPIDAAIGVSSAGPYTWYDPQRVTAVDTQVIPPYETRLLICG
jgi:hypothetical protein